VGGKKGLRGLRLTGKREGKGKLPRLAGAEDKKANVPQNQPQSPSRPSSSLSAARGVRHGIKRRSRARKGSLVDPSLS
jgi:hypothetical protein